MARRPLPFEVSTLKAEQLFGIPLSLKDSQGNLITYPDSAIESNIRAAVDEFERRLKIDLWPRRVLTRPALVHPDLVQGTDFDIDEDPLDYGSAAYFAQGWFQLRRWPVISVEKVEFRFPENLSIFVFPAEWLRVSRKSGQITVLATAGTAQPVIVAREGGYLPLFAGGVLRGDVPQLIYVDYTSGIDFQDEDNADTYHDLVLALKKKAAADTLLAVGRGVAPGLTSQSLSEDGQSESVSYARNKGSVYQAEIDSLTTDVEKFLVSFKQATKGLIFSVL